MVSGDERRVLALREGQVRTSTETRFYINLEDCRPEGEAGDAINWR
jgi:hypothetical protein